MQKLYAINEEELINLGKDYTSVLHDTSVQSTMSNNLPFRRFISHFSCFSGVTEQPHAAV